MHFRCRNSLLYPYKNRIHPRNKLDVGYRLSRSGLAVAYNYKNITYQGPIIASISVASDSRKVNITYTDPLSSSVELRNPNGFEVRLNVSFVIFLLNWLHSCVLCRYAV